MVLQHPFLLKMDISVVVVTYNQQDTIGRTLESILRQQTDAEFEIVVGDDCSTDGTEAVCRDYAARYPDRIRYVRRERNLGVVRNYFDCIARSRGRYLADCAGDDFWVDEHKLQRQLEVLENDADISLVATDWLCRDEGTGRLSRHEGVPEPNGTRTFSAGELTAPILNHSETIHLCTALYRKDLLQRLIDRDPDIFINPDYTCEDQQILLGMASQGKVVILPEVTLHYSVDHDSISHPRSAERRFDYSYGAVSQSLVLQRHFGVSDADMHDSYAAVTAHLAAMALRTGDRGRRDRLRRLIREHRLPQSGKCRLYIALMRVPPLWRISRKLLETLC